MRGVEASKPSGSKGQVVERGVAVRVTIGRHTTQVPSDGKGYAFRSHTARAMPSGHTHSNKKQGVSHQA